MRHGFRVRMMIGVVLFSMVARAGAQTPGVGAVSFPNTGAAAAQQDFLTALAQLHNFEHGPAVALFRKAQQTDPGFAMAYWGEAMTYNHPVWMEQDLAAARAVLQRLGPTPGSAVGSGSWRHVAERRGGSGHRDGLPPAGHGTARTQPALTFLLRFAAAGSVRSAMVIFDSNLAGWRD